MDNLRKLATYGIQDEEKPPKKPHVTICVGQCHGQANTNYVIKTWPILQTTGGKDEPNSRQHFITKSTRTRTLDGPPPFQNVSNPPVHVLRQESGRSCICLSVVSILTLFSSWYSLAVSTLIHQKNSMGCKWTWQTNKLHTKTQIKKEIAFLLAVLYYSHIKVFNNEHNS